MKYLLIIAVITIFPFAIGITVNSETSSGIPVKGVELLHPYPEHIAGAFTGGFGEQSCHSCHFDYDINQPEGEFTVSGIDESYEAGQTYTISLQVKRDDMNRGGFQMTARFEDGSQAGEFELTDNLTTTPNIANDITYLQHAVGEVEAENGQKSWEITWTAPGQADQPIIFHMAANAANGDASAFGDWIYLMERTVKSTK